jgi:hypothetical protein
MSPRDIGDVVGLAEFGGVPGSVLEGVGDKDPACQDTVLLGRLEADSEFVWLDVEECFACAS